MTARMIRYDEKYAKAIEDLVASSNGDIELVEDPNLKIDPFFYERKAHLDKTIEAVDNGTMKMYTFNDSMDELINKLETI